MAAPEIINIPFRKTLPLSLSSAIKQYISTKYDQHPDMFAADMATIDKLRADAVNVQEPHISGIQKLARYAAQLQWISGKFPIDIGADFSWYPAIGYNTNKAAVQNNLQFERANVLYNLAALYSQLAGQSPKTTPQGQKAACNYYCSAAGVLKYLKEEIIPELRSTPPEDMDAMTLECLEQLMLAQAQECFWMKAVDDNNKDSVVARLAASVSDYYDVAAEFGTKSTSIRSEWVHHMCAKQHHFAAAAQYRASLDCLQRSKYGEEVARLKDALEAASTAIKVEGRYINKTILTDLQGLRDKLADTLRGSEKDNDLIYLSPVPASSELPKLSRASMVSARVPKELSEATKMISETGPYGTPLFAKLVPYAVHQAASIYADRRDRLVNSDIVEHLESMTLKLHDLLRSLNLPGSIQALEKPLGLPPSIISHNEDVRQEGGIHKLIASISDIDKLKRNARALYSEAIDLLHAESQEDEQHRSRHGTDRWSRQSSTQAAGKLHGQVQEYDGILTSADKSDRLVRDKLTDSEHILSLLGGRLQDLKDYVPNSSRAVLTAAMDREVNKLRAVLNEISRLESRRRRKVEDLLLKAKSDDITTAILAEAARLERENPHRKVEAADFEPLFETRLDDQYAADKSILDTEAAEQQDLIARVKNANASFLASRKVDSSLAQREQALQNLENAYLKYRELISNLDVGRKFYNDLTKLLGRFRDECRHFVTTRRAEAGRFEVDIMNTMHNLRLTTAPETTSPMPMQPTPVPRPVLVPQQAPVPQPQPVLQPQQMQPMPGIWRGDSTTALKFAGMPPPPKR